MPAQIPQVNLFSSEIEQTKAQRAQLCWGGDIAFIVFQSNFWLQLILNACHVSNIVLPWQSKRKAKMEVTGLVLGALPIAIQAFQTYRTILSSMRNTKSDLESMIRELKTEMLILQNTCEILLRGIASDSEIEIMIDNPYDVAWSKYEDEVRLRLWRSGPSFQDLTEDMRKATAELQERLAINDQGKVSLFFTTISRLFPLTASRIRSVKLI